MTVTWIMLAVTLVAGLAGCTRPNPAYYPELTPRSRDGAVTDGVGAPAGTGGVGAAPGTGGVGGSAGGATVGGTAGGSLGGADASGSGGGFGGAGGSGLGGAGGSGLGGAGGSGLGGAGGSGLIPDLRLHWSFDEGPSRILDHSGNQNEGTPLGSPAFPGSTIAGAGSSNRAMAFDAVDDMLTLSAARNLPAVGGPLTVSFWVHALNTDVRGTVTILALLDGAGQGIHLGYYGAVPAVWVAGQSRVFLTHRKPPTPGWHHVAYTISGGNHQIYVDAIDPVSSGESTSANAISVVRLALPVSGEPLYQGQLDDVRIYSRALTAAEVADLARGF